MNQLVKFGAGGRSGQGTRRRTRHLASSRRAWRMEVGRAVRRRDFRGRLPTTSYNVSLDSYISPYNSISTPHGIPSVLVAFLRAGQSSGIPLASHAHAPGLVSMKKTMTARRTCRRLQSGFKGACEPLRDLLVSLAKYAPVVEPMSPTARLWRMRAPSEGSLLPLKWGLFLFVISCSNYEPRLL
jgi:hypothetical protein